MTVVKRDHTFLDKEKETVPLGELKSLQLEKLRAVVKFVSTRSKLYQQKKNLSPQDADFNSLEEFSKKIVLTTKQDLLKGGIYENLCVNKKKIIEVHFSSGTSARPVFSFLTKKDIKEGSEYLARTWYMQGVRSTSTFGMLASYGLFSAGLLNHYAIQRIGAFIIPIGGSSAHKTLDLFRTFSVDACAAVASYYPYLITIAKENNIRPEDLQLRHIVAGGEPFSEGQRQYVESELGATMYDQYGLCEINTGLAGECKEKKGLHILADYAYPEIIDPNTGEVLGEEQEGELVLTTLHKEASPLLRYRTGDITSITYDPCPCGRTMPRISRMKRRVTDVLFYKGVKVEKEYVAQLLVDLGSLINPYIWQMEVTSALGRDEIALRVVLEREDSRALDKTAAYLLEKLGFSVKTRLFTKDELTQLGNSKLKNFLDSRKAN